MEKTLILFLIVSHQALGILNKKSSSSLSAGSTREVYYAVDPGFQTGGNYRPARAPETLLGTNTPYYSGNGEFFEGPSTGTTPAPRVLKKCPQCHCSVKNAYLCGSNGKIYRSQCALTCAQMCDINLYKRSMSHCV